MKKRVMVLKHVRVPGKPGLHPMDDYEALFHQWGVNFHEFGENGAASYTAAVVEKDDGTIVLVAADSIRFTGKEHADDASRYQGLRRIAMCGHLQGVVALNALDNIGNEADLDEVIDKILEKGWHLYHPGIEG